MEEYLQELQAWLKSGKKIAWARVIHTWGSSPRPVGSCMFISSDQEMLGSVSGGCIEGAVLKEAKPIFENQQAKLLEYGVSDEDAWAVGLSCGGSISVYLQLFDETWASLLIAALNRNQGGVLFTDLSSGATKFIPANDKSIKLADEEILSEAKSAYVKRRHYLADEKKYFIHVFPPKKKLIIIGAVHIANDLNQWAKAFDFEVIIIDPRSVFTENTFFAVRPDKIYENYPSEVLADIELGPYTFAVILSHDPKIDDDALKILLRADVAYIGVLGSRKNHEKRTARLRDYGFSEEEVKRIHAPVGLDIRAQGAKEIALSIMAEIIKVKNSSF